MLFKESYEKRKCIISSNGYYEWFVNNNFKTPYFINIPQNEMIFFAGIWKYLNYKKNDLKTFTIITKPANLLLRKIHHRMPLILSINEAIDYLHANNIDSLNYNFSSSIENDIEYYKVSKFVNNPNNNSKECINPIN